MIPTQVPFSVSLLAAVAALVAAGGAQTAASDKTDLYRTCADIPGIVYEGQDEWSTRGWVNVANGKLIQAWCSTVSAGGRDG